MKTAFVKTSNWERFTQGVELIGKQGAPERCILLVTGEPGLGKTTMIDKWAVTNRAIKLTAYAGLDSPSKLYRALAGAKAEIGLHRDSDENRAAIIGYAVREGCPIVIDEVGELLGNSRLVEALRGISDMANTPLVLVGMEDVIKKLGKHKQVTSRVATHIEFTKLTPQDAMLTCQEKAEVQIAPDLAMEIARQCGGSMRLVLGAITIVEDFARANSLAEVKLADVKGKALTEDWIGKKGGRHA